MNLKEGTPEWKAYMAGRKASAAKKLPANPYARKRGKIEEAGWWCLGVADGKKLKEPGRDTSAYSFTTDTKIDPPKLPEQLLRQQEYCDVAERVMKELFCNAEEIKIPPSPFRNGASPYKRLSVDWNRLAVMVGETLAGMQKAKDEAAGPKP